MSEINEMMDEINSGLNIKIKMSYRLEKRMNKLWGKMRAREIALGRNLVKIMLKNYA